MMARNTHTVAVQVRVHGRVQGVWFRAWVREQATARGLTGWVRNRPDGTVEALFVGPPAAVEGMVAACGEGPEDARVAKVERAEVPLDQAGNLAGFVQRSSA
jgi:acylphosphatase